MMNGIDENFLGPSSKNHDSFRQAMHEAGIPFHGNIRGDGLIHRFATGNKPNKDGWYIFYGMAGAFGDWREGIKQKWSLKEEELSHSAFAKETHRLQLQKLQHSLEEDKRQKHLETARQAKEMWEEASEVESHPYLLKKKIEALGVRYHKDMLLVPLKDSQGKFWSLQKINSEGAKRFLAGGQKKGCFHTLGYLEDGKPILIAEGYATAASLHMATQHSVVVAFDAGNLGPVIEELQRTHPKSHILIAGDDDCWGEINRGRDVAENAAQKYACSVVFPEFKKTESRPTDFNDLHVLEGLEEVRKQIDKALLQLEWPEPQPLHSIKNKLSPVLPLPPQLIPEPYGEWLVDVAERMQCPLDYVAVGSLIVTASLIGGGCGVRPKALDSWTVIPNLWGGIVGSPSTLKSPALKEILRPLEILETEAFECYENDLQNYLIENEAYKASKETIKKEMLKAASDSNVLGMEGAKEKLRNLNVPQEPQCKRYSTNDVTIEKMHELLSHNERGLLLFRDELMGLLQNWEKQGHEADRAFYLEAWNGYGSKTTDRIGRGTIDTKNLCISILGSTQPSKLLSYFQKTLGGTENDGLLQRFQLLVYPDELRSWALVDRKPNEEAREQAFGIMKILAEMDFSDQGAYFEEKSQIPYFHFDHEAQGVFYEWLTELEHKLRNQPDEPLIIEHLTKYRKLMPSLALIFHLINLADKRSAGAITLDCVERAAGWCDYLESHARRIYENGINPGYQAARNLAKRIQAGELGGQTDAREIYRKQWSMLKTKEEVEIACHTLIEAGWLREEINAESRKRKKVYAINPKIELGDPS